MSEEILTQVQTLVRANPIATYFVAISCVTFFLFGYDKYKARAGWWRTPEKTLLSFCLVGGTLGGGIAMLVFRHKVSKHEFLLSYWAIAIIQLVLGICLYLYSRQI